MAWLFSGRLDVKQNPLYEEGGLAYLDTHYYGGIKKYQWVTIPLAMHGVVVKKDGKVIPVRIGEEDSDPVFCVTDLLVHLSQEQLKKAGYGQDDRVCSYTSLVAMLETGNVKRTSCCLLVDKEEIGSVGATGMHSRFFENTVAELMNACGSYSELGLRRVLANSCMLSSDVSSAFDAVSVSVCREAVDPAPEPVCSGGCPLPQADSMVTTSRQAQEK